MPRSQREFLSSDSQHHGSFIPEYSPEESCMFCASYDFSTHFTPIYALVQLFIYHSAHNNIVSSYDVKSMFSLRAWFRIVDGPNHALDGGVEDEVGVVIKSNQVADECATIGCDYADTL
jgi:hypothetical protein